MSCYESVIPMIGVKFALQHEEGVLMSPPDLPVTLSDRETYPIAWVRESGRCWRHGVFWCVVLAHGGARGC